MTVSSTLEFDVLSGFLLASECILAFECLSGLLMLACCACLAKPGQATDYKWNYIGNAISSFILLACMSSLIILALEPFALSDPIGGKSRALTVRLAFVLLLNESNVRYNMNSKDSPRFSLVWSVSTLVTFLAAAALVLASMFETSCDVGCVWELQTAIVAVTGGALAASNASLIIYLREKKAPTWACILALLRFCTGVVAGVFICLEAATLAREGRNTLRLQSPADSDYELYYSIQAFSIVVYTAVSLSLFWMSQGGLVVYRVVFTSEYTRLQYVDAPQRKEPDAWVF
jgi:hypothetical protein